MLTHAHGAPQDPPRVVVIGAGGFVGSTLARCLARDKIPHLPITRSEVDLLKANAAQRLQALLEPNDRVVVVAAIAPARDVQALLANLQMAQAVCSALLATPVAHVVYISSDAVFADDANPVTEESCREPSTLHGMMHAARELVFRQAFAESLAILRPSLLYGAADPHNGYGPNRFRRLAENREPITLFGAGEERRDHVYVEDLATVTMLALRWRSWGVLNVATGISTSFRRVAEMVCATHRAVEIRDTPRKHPITHRHFDITGALKAFPTFHYTTLDEGLRRAANKDPAVLGGPTC